MKRFFYLLLAIGCFYSAKTPCVIVKVDNLAAFQEKLQSLDSNALVSFDVDDTLIYPKDSIRHYQHRPIRERIVQKVLSESTPEIVDKWKRGYFISLFLLQGKSFLIDPKSLELIDQLKQRGIKTIALTAANTGPFEAIPSMMDWRINELNGLGINFNFSFPSVAPFLFDHLHGKFSDPGFKEGILFSCSVPKGVVLAAFLDRINWKPSQVIFIDDREDYIQSVDDMMTNLGIEVLCFHYKAIDQITSVCDEAIAEKQVRYFFQHEIWISDEEAAQFFQQE